MQQLFPTVTLQPQTNCALIPGQPRKRPPAPRHPTRRGTTDAPKAFKRAASNKKEFIPYQAPIASNEESKFRHQHWQAKRTLVRKILPQAGTTLTALESFDQCGAECVAEYCKEEQRFRLRGTFCHNRHCEPCQKQKANLLAANLRNRLEDRKEHQYRFITLTLKHTHDELRTQIDKLYASFRKLRASKMWKHNQKGGCAMLEVKWNPDTGEWHPHLHLIAEGDFIDKARLSQEWFKATGDSYVTDIKTLSSENDAAHYVAKYVSKGTNNEVWNNEGAAIEWVCAMKGTRTALTYGSWRGFKLLAKPDTTKEWKRIATLNFIIAQANQNDTYYISLLDAITRDLQYNPHKPRPKKPTISGPSAKSTP